MFEIASIAYNSAWAIAEQIRLMPRFLGDDFQLTVFDNSSVEDCAHEIEYRCDEAEVNYVRLNPPQRSHFYALSIAAFQIQYRNPDYFGFIDHDIWPSQPTRLVPFLSKIGFFGVGQRHGPTGHRYLWPGFAFFSKTWLAGRRLDFDGIRGAQKKDDGDCGSQNWGLFSDSDWENLDRYPLLCSYERLLDDPHSVHLQAWGYERFGAWIHFTNASRWMEAPSHFERERLMREVLREL